MNKITVKDIKQALKQFAEPERIAVLSSFFKTKKGEYGYGDKFLGVTVPNSRKIVKQFYTIPFSEIEELMSSPFHEERLVALLILVKKFSDGDEADKKTIYDYYLSHTKYINNWDLIDLSAEHIIGAYLLKHPKEKNILTKLAKSEYLWERRIAILSTFAFIKQKQYEETFRIAKILLKDKHDLIHKAVGWMLREVGKKCSKNIEMSFLKVYSKQMPSVMLRYALEHFSKEEKFLLLNKI